MRKSPSTTDGELAGLVHVEHGLCDYFLAPVPFDAAIAGRRERANRLDGIAHDSPASCSFTTSRAFLSSRNPTNLEPRSRIHPVNACQLGQRTIAQSIPRG